MPTICLAFIFLIAYAHSAGSWGECNDLRQVSSDVTNIESDIRALLQSSGDTLAETDTIHVSSAQCQYVSGGQTTFKVIINAGYRQHIIISYYTIGPQYNPLDLALISAGYKDPFAITDGYTYIDDIQDVRLDIVVIKGAIRKLLNASLSDDIIAVSGQSEEVNHGWQFNYRVTLNVGSRTGVIIEYFKLAALYDEAFTHTPPNPQGLKLIDAGVFAETWEDVDDLTKVKHDVAHGEVQIRWLINRAHGFDNAEEDNDIIVRSAQQQIMIGMKYRVTVDVGCYVDIVIEYFMDLPRNDPQQIPTNMQMVDEGDCFITAVQDTEHSGTVAHSSAVVIVVVLSISGLCFIGFGVGCAVRLWANKKRSENPGLYVQLPAEGENAIDAAL